MPDLSVIIPARKEEWLNRTVADVLTHSTADTEVIVVLDGDWPEEPLTQHDKLHVVYVPQAIGQRAATNLGARISTATYVAKLDAHCSVQQGWDTTLIEAAKELGPRTIQIPAQKNLHVYNWHCQACGRIEYQCGLTECRACNSPNLTREIVWKPKPGVHLKRWHFDHDLRYNHWGGEPKGPFCETMSCLGAMWFIAKDYWNEIGGLDERHGSWGQVGTEIGCKAWLSGGKLVTNNKTWFAHFFRVGGQKFPYPITGLEQEAARTYSKDLWLHNKWDGQIHPLRWMVDRFWPVPGWSEEQRDALPAVLDRGTAGHAPERLDESRVETPAPVVRNRTPTTRGLVYYTDSRLDRDIAATALGLLDATDLPLIAVSLAPVPHVLKNAVLPLERGYLSMFKQILIGLELLDVETVFLCEHDVLYSPTHFDFEPPDRSKVYYNQNVWKVDAASGKSLHYRCSQTSGLCADRQLLLAHYRKRVELVERHGFSRAIGFEPGTHNRPERVDDLQSEAWMSRFPNIDIRHDQNLTPSRWTKDEFRNQKFTEGWTGICDRVPGWGVTLGRFPDFLAEVRRGAVQQAVA